MSEMYPVQRRFSNGLEEPVHAHSNGTGPNLSGLDQEENSIREYFGLFRRHWFVVLAIVALSTGLAGYKAYTDPPQYRANAVIRLSETRQRLTGSLAGPGVNPAALGDPIISQIEVLRSRSVTSMVVDAVGLRLVPMTPDFSYEYLGNVQVGPNTGVDSLHVQFGPASYTASSRLQTASAAYGAPVQVDGISLTILSRPPLDEVAFGVRGREDAASALVQGLMAERRDRTNLIDVGYVAHDPILAMRVVNAAIEQFQIFNARAAQVEARSRRVFIEGRLAETTAELNAAFDNLAGFRSQERMFSPRQDLTVRQNTIAGLTQQRNELVADVAEYADEIARLRQGSPAEQEAGLRSLLGNPRLTSSPAVAPLYSEFVRYQTEHDSLTSAGYARTAPELIAVDNMLVGARSNLLRAMGDHLNGVNSEIARLQRIIAGGEQSMELLPGTETEEVKLLAQVEQLTQNAAALRTEYQQASIEEAVQAGQIETVDPALPGYGIADSQIRTIFFGIVLGLMLGGGAALLIENANTSIRRKDEVEKVLRIPELAVVPRFDVVTGNRVVRSLVPSRFRGNGASGSATVGELVTAKDPHSQASEAYRTLRTNLIFSQTLHPLGTIVVTSSAPSEGKSTTAANLAAIFAQQGKRVLLVDCDLRKARLHKMFGVPREPGFTHVLLGLKPLAEVVRQTSVEGLFFLASGTLPPNPAELVGGEQMKATLELLKSEFDLVILDTPPLLAASDAALVGRLADGVLLVIRAGQTERDAARQAVRQLVAGHARILGAVLNDPDNKVGDYGGHYRYEYYGEKVST